MTRSLARRLSLAGTVAALAAAALPGGAPAATPATAGPAGDTDAGLLLPAVRGQHGLLLPAVTPALPAVQLPAVQR